MALDHADGQMLDRHGALFIKLARRWRAVHNCHGCADCETYDRITTKLEVKRVKRPTPIERARDSYLALIRDTTPVGAGCDNCGELLPLDHLLAFGHETPDLNQRLDPGSVVPDGECPKCGAFCYRV